MTLDTVRVFSVPCTELAGSQYVPTEARLNIGLVQVVPNPRGLVDAAIVLARTFCCGYVSRHIPSTQGTYFLFHTDTSSSQLRPAFAKSDASNTQRSNALQCVTLLYPDCSKAAAILKACAVREVPHGILCCKQFINMPSGHPLCLAWRSPESSYGGLEMPTANPITPL